MIAHASETRTRGRKRQLCSEIISAHGVPLIDQNLINEYDLADRIAKRKSKRFGHSHVLATRPAKRWHEQDLKLIMSAWAKVPTKRVVGKSSPSILKHYTYVCMATPDELPLKRLRAAS